jgi:3-oxoacyl-[acyl-carrier protein] reductase
MTALPLDDHVAVVTGGAGAIGLAICRRLAEQGAAVALLDRGGLADATAGLEAARHRATGVAVDVRDAAAMADAVDTAQAALGPPTILVNAAGIVRPAMLHRMDDGQWNDVHDVVLKGAFNALRAVAPWFRDAASRRGRRVVNISSVAYHGGIGGANYTAAKAGINGLTRAAAREWAEFGVTVNAIAPGVIDAGLSGGMPEAMRERLVARIPLGRAGTADDVAAAVAFTRRRPRSRRRGR